MLEIVQTFTGLGVFKLEMFFLVLVRLSFLVFLMPFLDNQAIRSRVKVGLVFFLALIFWSQVQDTTITPVASPLFFFILVLKEAIIGIIMGFGMQFMVYFVSVAGYFMSRDMGFMQSTSMDPLTEEMSTDVSNLLIIMFSIIFLITGGHNFFILLMQQSFEMIPLAEFYFHSEKVSQVFLILSSNAFLLGIKMASPMIVTILLSQVGMAFIARVMPQMNIWIVGMPLKIGLGMLILISALPLMYQVFENAFVDLQYAMLGLLKTGRYAG